MTLPSIVHAFGGDALGGDDATGVAERLAAGEISPLEAVEAAISRIERVEPHLGALAFADFDAARERARRTRTPRGALGAVPALAKDNIKVRGMPMTMGSSALPAVPRSRDGRFARQLLDTGVNLLGTSAMPEFGLTATTERAGGRVTRNPWHTEFSAGGSSGGSAALVASGAVPIAHGNDGGGSIRIPAAVCGLVGLKPTRGRLLTEESADTMPVKLIAEGVLTRSVRDGARFLEAAELTHRNPALPPIGSVQGPPVRRLRIGVTFDTPAAPAPDAATREAVERTAELLDGLGHEVVEHRWRMPRTFRRDFEDYWALLALGIVTNGRRLFGPDFDASALEPLTLGLARRARRRLARMPLVVARLARSGRAYERSFADADVDVVLSPVLCHTTPRLGHLGADLEFAEHFARLVAYTGFTPWHNATGAPAISVPAGLTGDGLPVGVMFAGRRGADRRLLEIAFEVEEAAPFPRIADLAPAV